ncbi:MAG: hypothetical protein K0Q94_4246 [Paenibacillus sp.]|nr:hypothetical protein [Paenibacillus sp.]
MRKVRSSWVTGIGLTVMLLLAGCDNSDNAAEKPKAPEPGPIPIHLEAGTPAKYDPPIEFTTVAFSIPSVQYARGDDFRNNPWTRYIERHLGIKIHTIWTVPESEYVKKSNLMISSGELPDFFAATPAQFKQLAQAGLLEDLTPVYDNHAPEIVKKVIRDAGPEVIRSAEIDDRLMAIPFTGTAKESPPILWIRKDWMEKLELSAPKTMDDVWAISEAFTFKDPDGNGKHDTFGLALDRDLGLAIGLLTGYHAYWDIWFEGKDGKLAYSTIQPEMKRGLLQLKELFQAGQIDPEFTVKPAFKVFEGIGSGKIGMMAGARGSANYPLASLTPDREWQAYAIPSADGDPVLYPLQLNIYKYYWVVKKGTKHPEALLHMLELWLNAYYFNTSEELFYTLINPSREDKSATWSMAPIRIYLPDNNIENYRQVAAVLNGTLQAGQLAPERRNVYERTIRYLNGDQKLWGEYAQNGPGGSGAIIDDIIRNDRFQPNRYTSTPTPTMTERGEALNKLRDETFLRIIAGTAPIEEFDNYVYDWKRLGGDAITQEVNAWYAAQK